MLYICQLTHTASSVCQAEIVYIVDSANFSKNDDTEIEFGLSGGRKVGEHDYFLWLRYLIYLKC